MLKSVEFIVGLVVFLFLFFGLFLFFFQKGDRISKNLLGFFFISLGLAVADVFLLKNGTYMRFPQYANFLTPLPLVYGPLLWLFTKSVVGKDFQLKQKDLYHFIPFAVLCIGLIFIYHIRSLDFKKEYLRRTLEDPVPIVPISSLVIFIIIGIYIYNSYKSINRYRSRIKEEVSNIDKINLGWLDFTLLGFIIILVLSLAVQVAVTFSPDNNSLNLLLLILLFVLLLFIMGAIIKGLRSDVSFKTKLPPNEKDGKSKKLLSDEEKNKLKSLKALMRSGKPFLDPSLTLQDLSKKINISSRELSYLINHGEGISFFDFINKYRIQYAKDKIADSEDAKLTILEVMYASGFNSKSSFNTAFKKHSGYTPTQWKKINS